MSEINRLHTELGNMKQALLLAQVALTRVIKNQEYQKRTGGKYFTSAPTEYEWKRDSQDATDKAVKDALEKIDEVLYGKPKDYGTLDTLDIAL